MDFTPLMIINGWLCLFLLSKTSSTGLDAARITLWDSIWVPSSQAKVTSLKSLSSRSFWKAEFMLVWKSFHWRQSCSDSIFADLYFLCARTHLGTEKGQGRWVGGWVGGVLRKKLWLVSRCSQERVGRLRKTVRRSNLFPAFPPSFALIKFPQFDISSNWDRSSWDEKGEQKKWRFEGAVVGHTCPRLFQTQSKWCPCHCQAQHTLRTIALIILTTQKCPAMQYFYLI